MQVNFLINCCIECWCNCDALNKQELQGVCIRLIMQLEELSGVDTSLDLRQRQEWVLRHFISYMFETLFLMELTNFSLTSETRHSSVCGAEEPSGPPCWMLFALTFLQYCSSTCSLLDQVTAGSKTTNRQQRHWSARNLAYETISWDNAIHELWSSAGNLSKPHHWCLSPNQKSDRS